MTGSHKGSCPDLFLSFLFFCYLYLVFSLKCTIFLEELLSELVPTLTGESNFASWSTALKYTLKTPASTSTTTNKPTTANALLSNPIARYNNLFNN